MNAPRYCFALSWTRAVHQSDKAEKAWVPCLAAIPELRPASAFRKRGGPPNNHIGDWAGGCISVSASSITSCHWKYGWSCHQPSMTLTQPFQTLYSSTRALLDILPTTMSLLDGQEDPWHLGWLCYLVLGRCQPAVCSQHLYLPPAWSVDTFAMLQAQSTSSHQAWLPSRYLCNFHHAPTPLCLFVWVVLGGIHNTLVQNTSLCTSSWDLLQQSGAVKRPGGYFGPVRRDGHPLPLERLYHGLRLF